MYLEQVKTIESKSADVYHHLNFDQIPDFKEVAYTVAV